MDTNRERLKEMLATHALKENRAVLASGQVSEYFVEARAITVSAMGAHLVGRVVLEAMEEWGLKVPAVGGMEGVVPMAISISIASLKAGNGRVIEPFAIRRKPGNNGQRLWVDGFRQRAAVVVLEEVATTGLPTVEVIKKVQEVRMTVQAVIALVDREEGAAGKVREYCPFYAIYTGQELFECRANLSGNKTSII